MPRNSTTKSSSARTRVPRWFLDSPGYTSPAESSAVFAGTSTSKHDIAFEDSEAFAMREFAGGKARSAHQTHREQSTPAPNVDLGMDIRTYDAVDALLMLSRSHEHPNVQPSSLKPSKLYSYPKDEIESQKKHCELLVKTFRKKRFATFDAEELMEPGDTEEDFASHARRARRLIAQEVSRAIKLELNPFVGRFTATQAICLPCNEWNLLDSRQLFYAGNLVGRHMRGKSGSKTGVNQCHPSDLVQLMIRTTDEIKEDTKHMMTHLGKFFEREMPVLKNSNVASSDEIIAYYDACCECWRQQWWDIQHHVVDVVRCDTCASTIEKARDRAENWR
ncbi:hypothetical protein FISHEDRAFT_70323 [Fistulina hepatica ATCC 64428]|uniref:Uncharacterized protein n=1 Tax=Fistulina hepatica ATCC 64428 TaxID=1128425 RepID=A0A0D7ALA9_9AGAR|nr:hypothetical protein FISHEDRAFT_70323 [Fistulina hepatica ATCC 64428]